MLKFQGKNQIFCPNLFYSAVNIKLYLSLLLFVCFLRVCFSLKTFVCLRSVISVGTFCATSPELHEHSCLIICRELVNYAVLDKNWRIGKYVSNFLPGILLRVLLQVNIIPAFPNTTWESHDIGKLSLGNLRKIFSPISFHEMGDVTSQRQVFKILIGLWVRVVNCSRSVPVPLVRFIMRFPFVEFYVFCPFSAKLKKGNMDYVLLDYNLEKMNDFG